MLFILGTITDASALALSPYLLYFDGLAVVVVVVFELVSLLPGVVVIFIERL